MHILKFHCINL